MRYFEGKDEAIRKEAESWLNTPYRHMGNVKGKGVDCIHFVVAVLRVTGATQGRQIVIKPYPKDWHLHRGEELLKESIEKQLYVSKLTDFDKEVQNGDIVMFRFGRHAAHCGIFYNGEVYQTLNHSGVEKKNWKDSEFRDRVTDVYMVEKWEQ